MWPGDARHPAHPAAALALDEVGEGVGAAGRGRHHEGGAQQCDRAVLSGDHRQAWGSGAAALQQRSAHAQDGLVRDRAVSGGESIVI